ncbi:3-methyl-2-oxobutanoate hydroxymethyltransferase [Penicillium odoratum]|uniref:3-methyl-2-oxobutanoate hydroxymethyltransferase n=1 Tax=Penicillium odoratum TaxID=1167516 RepID=UPI0025498CCF|nr:3-methyl-2-oxobutanoate hydroxymethyltransferase [Penicillium odoratum]KAJ5777413.1 3-methyl-2-oxobutanoate hydroxymethyltransferase [Penicillium odoratum]
MPLGYLRHVGHKFKQNFVRPRSLIGAQSNRFAQKVILRQSSHSSRVSSDQVHKKVTINTLDRLYQKGEPITVLTAHDFPSASVADAVGIEVVLVGDSLAMVAMGMEDTNEVTMEEMLLHCRSVSRAVKSALVIADLPMGSYESSPEEAVRSAIRMVKEGHVSAVKLEGGKEMAPTIRKISQMGIPVMAHVGLTPQRQHSTGGFRVQGKTIAGAVKLLKDALAVQEAGAFMILIEAVPPEVAAMVTQKLRVPTIGIGAGANCSGQVLVQVDMTGNFQPGTFTPKFVKRYADVWGEAFRGIDAFKKEVKDRTFPAEEHTYSIPKDALEGFQKYVKEESSET